MKKLFTLIAVLIVLAVIITGIGRWLGIAGFRNDDTGQQMIAEPDGPITAVNPAGCAPFEVIAAPGTWESSSDDNPVNPMSHPNALLLAVTRPLQAQYRPEKIKVWTVPYVAQFRNIGDLSQTTYDDSRQEGKERISAEMTSMHRACPATRFFLLGFSQGAVIMGDLASDIGNQRGPVPSKNIAGVALIADGRQEPGKGTLVGKHAHNGVGAEIALQPVNTLAQFVVPGASMRGSRTDGFGRVHSRVTSFCAVGDLICDAPSNISDAGEKIREIFGANPIHSQYATNNNILDHGTVVDYIITWVKQLITA